MPGSGPGGYWQQFTPPAGAAATLEARLGERWLGPDIGEQDGRYIGGYAGQMTPPSASYQASLRGVVAEQSAANAKLIVCLDNNTKWWKRRIGARVCASVWGRRRDDEQDMYKGWPLA